jgi:hypothetical protein
MTCLPLSTYHESKFFRGPLCETVLVSGFFDSFFHPSDFLLSLPGHLFNEAAGFQAGILRYFSRLALDRAFQFVESAFCLVFSASLDHRVSRLAYLVISIMRE